MYWPICLELTYFACMHLYLLYISLQENTKSANIFTKRSPLLGFAVNECKEGIACIPLFLFTIVCYFYFLLSIKTSVLVSVAEATGILSTYHILDTLKLCDLRLI